jgi:hypothetical protein
MVFVEGDDYRQLRRPGDDPAQFRSVVRPRRVQPPDPPGSVIHQYRGENFTTSTWTDSVGNADMSINGVSASTLNGSRAASSDGVDDFGVTSAPGPESLPEQETFGIAVVFRSTDQRDLTTLFSAESSTSIFELTDSDAFDNLTGELRFRLQDNNRNTIVTETSDKFFDGDTHLLCLNKNGNNATDVNFYVDDMNSQVKTNEPQAQKFNNTAYTNNRATAFFASNVRGSIARHLDADMPFIEFNSDPYSQQDRLDLKQRAPGL